MDKAVALVVKITSDARGVSQGVDGATQRVSKLGQAGKVAGRLLAAGLLIAVGAAIKFTSAAADDAQASAKLAATAQQVAGATKGQTAAMEDWITAQGKSKGVTDDELRPALEKLLTATHSVAKSQQLASLAMDISARTGKSLESVTQSLAKAQTGSVTGLSKYGVATKDAAGHARALADIQADLAKSYTGAAAAGADTAAGKAKILSVQMGELQEQIGYKLLPVMTKLATVGLTVVNSISQHSNAALALVGVIGALLAIIKLVSFATSAWTAITKIAAFASKAFAAAQWLLNAALNANPIGLIVIAIAALVVALVLAYKHSATFRAIVQGAFHAVAAAAGAAVDFIREHWRLILAILTGPVGIAVGLIARHWDTIRAGAANVIGWIRGRWSDLKGLLAGPINAAEGIISRAWDSIKAGAGAVKSVVSGAFSAIATVVQRVIDKVQALIDKIQSIPGVPGGGGGSGSKAGGLGPGGVPVDSRYGARQTVVNNTITVNGLVGDRHQLATELDKIMTERSRRLYGATG